jgi:hypothetical protein
VFRADFHRGHIGNILGNPLTGLTRSELPPLIFNFQSLVLLTIVENNGSYVNLKLYYVSRFIYDATILYDIIKIKNTECVLFLRL